MPPITLVYHPSAKIHAAATLQASRLLSQVPALRFAARMNLAVVMFFVIVPVGLALWSKSGAVILGVGAALGLVMIVIAWANQLWRQRWGRLQVEYYGQHELTLSEAGIFVRTQQDEQLFFWSRVKAFQEMGQQEGDYLSIRLDPTAILPIPNSAFPDADTRTAFLAALQEGMAKQASASEARTSLTATPPHPPIPASVSSFQASSLWRDLAQLPRLLLLRAPRPGTLTPEVYKLVLLVPLFFLILIVEQIARWGGPGHFVWHNFDAPLLPLALVVLTIGLTRMIAGAALEVGRFWLVAFLLVLFLPLADVWRHSETLVALWLALAISRQVLPSPNPCSARVFTAYMVAMSGFSATFLVFNNEVPFLWIPAQTEAEEDEDWPTIDEVTLYAQPRLLEEALAAVQPGVAGKPELFFLGVGGEPQNVFLREVESVQKLFAERYATAGHSLLLANNAATLQTLPMANMESLRQALRRIGEQMNPEEDVLFLFLTSHGDRDFQFSFDIWPLRFNGLYPNALKTMLEEAGIQRRVLVVSACYSGGFIPALQDENTLVITSAAADKASFGCGSNNNDFTDFGRAYFDEALRETRSFPKAYALAAARIAAREQSRHLSASNPQMAGGAALTALLREITGEE
jgi:hypothetical protein